MPVKENRRSGFEFWPSARELGIDPNKVVFLPSSLSEQGGESVAGFRPAAQEMRIRTINERRDVELFTPDGAIAGVHQEYAADVVLPYVYSGVASVALSVLANYIYDWLKSGARKNETIRCGLVEVENGRLQIRDLEGPAPEILDLLEGISRDAAEGEPSADE